MGCATVIPYVGLIASYNVMCGGKKHVKQKGPAVSHIACSAASAICSGYDHILVVASKRRALPWAAACNIE